MGFNNPRVSWSEIERRLSDRGPVTPAPATPAPATPAPATRAPVAPAPATQGSSTSPVPGPGRGAHRYAELHCHSAFSFLDGASTPEELAEEATELGLEALAITDHHGFYGVVRFAEAARTLGLPSVFGAEVTLGAAEPRQGPADPDGRHLVILARDPTGYAKLASLLSQAQMAGEKGHPRLSFADVAEAASGRARGHWAVLTGCRKGTVPAALVEGGPAVAQRELRALVAAFGAEHTFVELWDHGDPLDSTRNDALARLAVATGLQPIVTNNVHYARPSGRRLASAMAAVRARRSMQEIDAWLPAAGMAHLRSGAEQHRRFARYPGAVDAAADLGRSCAFDLALVAPSLPPFPCPPTGDGRARSEPEFLRHLVEEGGARRYGPRHAERTHGAWAQIDHELDLICALGFPGYFLVVWDLVEFCRRNDILCQGRGSAANSAVCYALGITNADAVGLGHGGRVALRLNVELPTRQTLDFVAVHLHHVPADKQARLEQTMQLVAWLNGRRRVPRQIIAGDFNAVPTEPAIQYMKQAYRSAYAERYGREPLATYPTALVPTDGWSGCLDYIFVSTAVPPIHHAQLFCTRHAPDDNTLYPSDHVGVLATINLS